MPILALPPKCCSSESRECLGVGGIDTPSVSGRVKTYSFRSLDHQLLTRKGTGQIPSGAFPADTVTHAVSPSVAAPSSFLRIAKRRDRWDKAAGKYWKVEALLKNPIQCSTAGHFDLRLTRGGLSNE